jgi:hypothetical protein
MKRKTTMLLCLVALLPVGVGQADAESLSTRTALLSSAPRHLSAASWWGGTFAVAGGEHVELHISARYPESGALAQQWVDFFGRLPHGPELSLARVYIAPLDQVSELCYSDQVVGCYGAQTIVTVGDTGAGYSPTSIAAHEYGHHIAANRTNAPWAAGDWGTKRWASVLGICARVATGTAFPGDEGANYSLNPAEGFAESYRVVVETNGTALGFEWPLVDPSFHPTAESLASLREDMFHPWVGPTARTIRGTFLRRRRIWSTQVATPLDGDLRVRVTVPGSGADDVTLLTGDGRTVLATGTWTSSGGRSAEYRVCGARSVRVRVTRGGAAARFTLQIQVP